MRLARTRTLIATGCIAIVLTAFARGDYLLGSRAGILFATVAAATLCVIVRVSTANRRFQFVRQSVALLFGLAVFVILASPSRFNPELNYFIDGHRSERSTQSQLRSVFNHDLRFSTLEYECVWSKCIVVVVSGRINSESDMLDLRDRIFAQCPEVSSRWLYWRVKVDDSGVEHDACDLTIYGDHQSKAGK